MINIYKIFKDEGLMWQDPNDPSGSTWVTTPDAQKILDTVEKIMDHCFRIGRAFQIDELRFNKVPHKNMTFEEFCNYLEIELVDIFKGTRQA